MLLQTATRGQECSGVFFFPPLSLMPSLQLSVCLLRVNVDTHMHAKTELHMNMNIDFLWENLDVYTHSVVLIKENACADITSQLLPSLG